MPILETVATMTKPRCGQRLRDFQNCSARDLCRHDLQKEPESDVFHWPGAGAIKVI